jgi:hypothetical protein
MLMKTTRTCPFLTAITFISLSLNGCLVSPVEKSGGIGSVTVTNSNPSAIINAAQGVFPNYGYTPSTSHFPTSVSFDKEADRFARVMWGSYGDPQTIRVKVQIIPIPGGNDYRLIPKLYTISNVGEAGFESKRPLAGLWNSEFAPLLKQVSSEASGAGTH